MRAICVQVKRGIVLLVLWLLVLSLVGCGRRDREEESAIPQLEEVEKITITINHPLVKGAAAREAVLSTREAIAPILNWLGTIDWSQGQDMAPIRLAEPDGRLVIRLKNGTEDFLGWYWDGKLTSQRRNLLVRTNPTAFQKVIQASCP